jgi:gamma-glutamyltranspeptidase/glutathione hydrolase
MAVTASTPAKSLQTWWAISRRGSLLEVQGFAATRATWSIPIASSIASHDSVEIPPNRQGLTMLIALNILKNCGVSRFEAESPARRHFEMEVLKLAWELRNQHSADLDFADVPVTSLLDDAAVQGLARLIGINTYTATGVALPAFDTVYLSVVDKNRMSVSFINSLYFNFGVGIVIRKSGIMSHNRGHDVSTRAHQPDRIAPAKRPLHTIIPAMVR